MVSISNNRGLGLIELLVSTALGVTLATAVIQVYTANSQAARDLESRIRVQESGRLALHFLLRELRAAASLPSSHDCSPEQWLVLGEASASPDLQNILGWEAAGTAPGDSHGSALHDASTEVVDSDRGGWLSSAGEMERLSLLPGSDVIGIFKSCDAPVAGVPANGVRQGTYFYVGKRGGAVDNPPSLFRHSGDGSGGRSEELFEGVANLQVLYGVARGSGNRLTDYVTANEVEDWQRVTAVRLTILLQSVEDVLAMSQPYVFHGVRYDGGTGNGPAPGDRRLRRVFSTTLALPGRLTGGME